MHRKLAKRERREAEEAKKTRWFLQDAQYVIKSVICNPNFERLILGCIEADFCK